MPALTKVNANLYDNLQTLSDVAKEETEIVEEYLKYITEKITKDGKILTQKFLKLSEPVKRKLVYNLFISHNLDYDRKKILTVLDFIKENSASKSGKTCSLTSDLWIFASEKYAQVISKTDTAPTYIDIRKEGEYETENFVFEILENEDIDNYDELVAFVDRIHFFGGKISIDDFGSGYSNLMHIANIHSDFLKIDGSIIRNACTDEQSANLISLIMYWKKISNMQFKIVAEFVENAEIQNMLMKHGIDYSQGYYFSKPAPDLIELE